MVEITDSNSYINWLKLATPEVCAVLAIRSALRVFPLAAKGSYHYPEGEIQFLFSAGRALLTLSSGLIHGVERYTDLVDSAFGFVAIDASEDPKEPVFASNLAADACWIYAHDVSIDLTHDEIARNSAHAAARGVYAALGAYNVFPAALAWAELNKDIQDIESGLELSGLLEVSLWRTYNPLSINWGGAQEWMHETFSYPDFWIDWYERILEGRPQNWKMLEEIAFIDAEDWEQGAEHVNALIAEIQARYAVKESVTEAQIVLNDAPPANAQMGHNNPPDDIEDIPYTKEDEELIARVLQDLADETEKAKPDASTVVQIKATLQGITTKIDDWIARRGVEIRSGFFGAFGAWLFNNIDKLQVVIEAIKDWLPFLS